MPRVEATSLVAIAYERCVLAIFSYQLSNIPACIGYQDVGSRMR